MQSRMLRELRRSPVSIAGISILLAFLVVALLAPVITEPNRPNPYRLRKDMLNPLSPPRAGAHLLGTDAQGSDILYGLVWGCRLSIKLSLQVVLAAMAIGMVVGLVAGYYGGPLDIALMSVTDVFMAVPPYILAMAILASFGATLENLSMTLMVVYWPRFARVMRSQVLSAKELAYVEAARSIGVGTVRMLFKHVLPNAIAPIFVQATLSVGSIVLWTAGLSFIGLAPPDLTEWGNMVSLGRKDMLGGYWWPSVFPGLMIFLFVLGVNLLGDGLRDALDPKTRGRWSAKSQAR